MPEKSFRIETVQNCTVVFGGVPMETFGEILKKAPRGAEMDAHASGVLGATFVFGTRADLNALRANLRSYPLSKDRAGEAEAADLAGHSPELVEWLKYGERGQSSNALCSKFFGIGAASDAYPRDPDDLRRCLLFLGTTNTASRVHEMANVSSEWAALVNIWLELETTFREEASRGLVLHKTYQKMTAALESQPAEPGLSL